MRYYKNNENIKGIGQPLEYTKEQVDEYVQCASDPVHFINNYCKIVTIDNGLQPFKLYDVQADLIRAINDNRKVLCLAPRQVGKTQVSAGYILWYTLFQPNKTVAILANKGAVAREILYRYQSMYEYLPHWLQQGIRTWNKGDIALENGSIVFTGATSPSGIRSRSVSLLYIDEAAIIPNTIADQFFASVYPTISSGKTAKILISSTPLGYNHFWKFWKDSENKVNDFARVLIDYKEVPGRDEAWANEQLRLLGEVKFNQEVLCLGPNVLVKIRDKYTKEERTITIQELYKNLESKMC